MNEKIDPFADEEWEDDIDALDEIFKLISSAALCFSAKRKKIKVIRRSNYLSLYYVDDKKRQGIMRVANISNEIFIFKDRRAIKTFNSNDYYDIKSELYIIIKRILTDFFDGYEEKDVE